jgi:hypothetical protein
MHSLCDGPDGQATKGLLDFQCKDGTDFCFQAHQLYAEIRQEVSCVKLRRKTPLPDANIVCESAATTLQQHGDEGCKFLVTKAVFVAN